MTKFGPGGGSALHHHTYNHAFYFLTGDARVQIGNHGLAHQAGHVREGARQ